MNKTIIFDIDGTLADCTHRLHHIRNKPKNYTAFFDAMPNDIIVTPIRDLLTAISKTFSVVLCSGRPDSHEQQTTAWLEANDIYLNCEYDALYMRKSGDYRADIIIKKEMLLQIREDGFEPFLVIDDRPSVVAMWRAEGLTCLQCDDSNWNESSFYMPIRIPTLTLMVGPSGAGKTKWALTHYENSHILSSDQIRQDLTGDLHNQKYNEDVFAAIHAQATARLSYGLDTVIDATNLRRANRMIAVDLAKGGPVHYIIIDRPMLNKIQSREWRSEELIRRHDQIFQSQLKDILAGDNLPNVTVFDKR